MAENSKIEWTDHTVNLWWGCAKVHTGCKNCYAESLSNRYGNDIWGEKKKRKRIKSAFNDLAKYQKQAEKENKIVKVFMGSMMDIFEESKELLNPKLRSETTEKLRSKLFANITVGHYPNLVFLFLTKRPENIVRLMPHNWFLNSPDNVWFGTSVSNMETWDKAIELACIPVKRFLSIEPQVGMIDNVNVSHFDWVIQGGESGSKKRPFDINWAYKMKQICKEQNTPFFFKQIDKIQPIPQDLMIRQFPNFGSVGKNILELETETSNETQK